MGGLLGITETEPDVFVVVGGNFSSIGVQINGTGAAWNVDLRHSSSSGPKVKLITQIRESQLLNAVIPLPDSQTEVLFADSAKGLAWRLNTITGKYDIAVQVPEMNYAPGSPLQIGVNGIRVYQGYLYWTSTFVSTIYRVKINNSGGIAPAAKVETVMKVNAQGVDDFVFDRSGNIWAMTDLDNRVVVVKPSNKKAVFVESALNELTVAGDTAAQFGRGARGEQTLCVVTSGGLANPVNGTVIEGDKVVAIDTAGFSL